MDVPSGFLQALRGVAGVPGAGRQSPAALRTEARQDSALRLPDKKQPPSLQTSARQLSSKPQSSLFDQRGRIRTQRALALRVTAVPERGH